MASSWMVRRVALVRVDVLQKPSTSIIRITRIGEPGNKLALTGNRLLIPSQRAKELLVTTKDVLVNRLLSL
jgi:hypothetical protein